MESSQVTSRKVSVITITFNHKAGLETTLANVAAQSWGDMEQVVIDGGSTDGTAQLLESHVSAKSFSYVSEPDEGIYDAMNKGWQKADGDLVVFMNAGDTFSSDTVVEVMARAHAVEFWRWGYGCARVLGADGRPTEILTFVPYRLDRHALGLTAVPHQAVVIERSLLQELGGFRTDVGLAADQELLLRASLGSPPRLWGDFFANYEGGGVGSSMPPGDYIRDLAMFRANLGIHVAGGRVRDGMVTMGLRAFKSGAARLGATRRQKGSSEAELFNVK